MTKFNITSSTIITVCILDVDMI